MRRVQWNKCALYARIVQTTRATLESMPNPVSHAAELPMSFDRDGAATALLLAAGRGERMRPLTDAHPKPLLRVRGKPLMQWAMEALQRGGVRQLVINTAWLGEQIPQHFGTQFSLPENAHTSTVSNLAKQAPMQAPMQLHYSQEGVDFGGALETAGGIVRALPQLSDVFWVAAGDVFAPEFVFSEQAFASFKNSSKLAHIWLVPNPTHNPLGDFGVSADGLALNLPKPSPAVASTSNSPNTASARYTFSTIALYKRTFFEGAWCDIPAGNPQGIKAPLAPMLRQAMDNQQVSASLYTGPWADVGTPERLAQLNQHFLRE
jgi:MurNAc alpha-1-phosphate uridylyltransferase